jgi:hypothetical protein
LWYLGETFAYGDCSDAVSGIRKRGGTTEFGDKSPTYTFSGTLSFDEFTGVARSYIDALDPCAWRTAERYQLWQSLFIYNSSIINRYGIIRYGLIDGDETSHCAYRGNDKRQRSWRAAMEKPAKKSNNKDKNIKKVANKSRIRRNYSKKKVHLINKNLIYKISVYIIFFVLSAV